MIKRILRHLINAWKLALVLSVFLFQHGTVSGQNQKVADSVKITLQKNHPIDSIQMIRLKLAAQNETDPVLSLDLADQLIAFSLPDSLYDGLTSGYIQKGNANRMLGNLEDALKAYFVALDITKESDHKLIGIIYIAIADIYSVSGNSNNAIIYYNRGIDILREGQDSVGLGSALFNTGDEYLNNEVYDTALQYFVESGEIFRNVNFLLGTGYNLGNMGKVYAWMGDLEKAESNLNESIEILEEFEDYYPISVYLTDMSKISTEKGDMIKSLEYAKRSLELAENYNLKEQIGQANLQLSVVNESLGNYNESLQNYKKHIIYRDSLNDIETVEKLANLRTEYEVSEKQLEVDLLNQQKKIQQIVVLSVSGALFLIGLLAFGLFRRNIFIKRTNTIIEKERDRSEKLLLNILPAETAEELKQYGHAKAKNFGMVSVIFTDFKEFTGHSERLSPEDLVAEIDHCFKGFDLIMETYNVEKIKTVGDAYLAAAGLPISNVSNPVDAVKAALAIRDFMIEYKTQREEEGREAFEMRIGVNTGPIVAGIVGIKKFQYDIWGDTVNLASRMESTGEVGKVNISQSTYDQIKDNRSFIFTSRGKINAKHKGEIHMYYVERAMAS